MRMDCMLYMSNHIFLLRKWLHGLARMAMHGSYTDGNKSLTPASSSTRAILTGGSP